MRAKGGPNWVGSRIEFGDLVRKMIEEDLKIAERDALVRKHGYSVMNYYEL